MQGSRLSQTLAVTSHSFSQGSGPPEVATSLTLPLTQVFFFSFWHLQSLKSILPLFATQSLPSRPPASSRFRSSILLAFWGEVGSAGGKNLCGRHRLLRAECRCRRKSGNVLEDHAKAFHPRCCIHYIWGHVVNGECLKKNPAKHCCAHVIVACQNHV